MKIFLYIYLFIQLIPLFGGVAWSLSWEFMDWWDETTKKGYSVAHILLIVLFAPFLGLMGIFELISRFFKMLLKVKIIKK